jgi:hypothetical protein
MKTWQWFVVTLVITLMAAPMAAADSLTGTWTLNVAKSKFGTGSPPKSQTTKLESIAGGLREIVDRVNADGSTTHWEVTAMYDGKDHPVVGDPSRDTVALKKIADSTIEVTNKKAGTVTTRMRIAVSPDGKTRTNTVQGTDASGKPFTSVMLFDLKK